MANAPWFIVVFGAGAVLGWAVTLGIKNWRTFGGKVTAIVAGALLLVLVAFVALVAVIVISGQAGHPF